MNIIKLKLRKWGDSLGTIIPSEIIRKLNMKEQQEINIIIVPDINPLEESWNSNLKISRTSQQIKDDMRKEWNR
jgi:hypothetical protein